MAKETPIKFVERWTQPQSPSFEYTAGEAKFTFSEGIEGPTGLRFVCPCGCGDLAGIVFQQGEARGWTWNGKKEGITCTPSIIIKPCGWHGYLTDGVFRDC